MLWIFVGWPGAYSWTCMGSTNLLSQKGSHSPPQRTIFLCGFLPWMTQTPPWRMLINRFSEWIFLFFDHWADVVIVVKKILPNVLFTNCKWLSSLRLTNISSPAQIFSRVWFILWWNVKCLLFSNRLCNPFFPPKNTCAFVWSSFDWPWSTMFFIFPHNAFFDVEIPAKLLAPVFIVFIFL